MTLRTNAPVQYVAELTVYDADLADVRTLYVSTHGFTSTPTDTPASTVFDGRLLQPALLQRDLFAGGRTAGASTLTAGDLRLANPDGGLDGWLDYAFDGRPITIRVGPPGAAYPAGYTLVLTGIMEQVEVSSDAVTVRLRDRQFEVTQPFQPTKYAGTNALPNGIEGVAADLKGKPKPILYGKVFNIAPPCVNTSALVYQLADAALQSVDAVYDRGAALTFDANYATSALLIAATIGAGKYATCLAEGLMRLQGTPSGLVTCDATEGATTADRTVAQIYKRILVNRLGKSAGEYSSADVTALDTAAPYVVGGWWATETTTRDVFDALAASVGAAWYADQAGVYRLTQFAVPSGTPAATFTAADVLSARPLTRTPVSDPTKGIPVTQCVVRYAKNYTVQDLDLAGTVTDARRAVLAQPYADTSYTDATVATAHLLAQQLVDDTLLTAAADALAEATRRQALYGTRRDRFEFAVMLTDATAALDLGQVIALTHPRYGLSGGRLFRIIGLAPNAGTGTLTLTVWG